MLPSREEALQARVKQLKRENFEMKNDMANMASGVMSVFKELLLRKMRDANANFDEFPKEAIDNWSAHMYDQSSKLDKCEPLLRDTAAFTPQRVSPARTRATGER
jgi:Rod binding domain-containing protein